MGVVEATSERNAGTCKLYAPSVGGLVTCSVYAVLHQHNHQHKLIRETRCSHVRLHQATSTIVFE